MALPGALRPGSTARGLGLLAAALVAGCSTPPRGPVTLHPPPPPVGATLVVPPPVPDWRDEPLTPGNWRYAALPGGGSQASYGAGTAPVVTLRCDPVAQRVVLLLVGATAGPVVLRTSTAAHALTAQAGADGAQLLFAPRDPLLDEIAFSRGRFSLSGRGIAPRLLPAWAEPARVVEDCRG